MIPLAPFQARSLETGLPFVTYRLPGAALPVTLWAEPGGVRAVESPDELSGEDGFLIAPFARGEAPLVFLSGPPPSEGWSVEDRAMAAAEAYHTPAAASPPPLPCEVTREEYLEQVRRIEAALADGGIEKVVLSRAERLEGVGREALPGLFAALCARYPEAFVYLLSTPHTGVWMGASPELLVEVSAAGAFRAMALAATRRAGADRAEPAWTEKDRREQALVAAYMRDRLRRLEAPFVESPVTTTFIGNLAHLCTMFEGQAADPVGARARLIEALHPNPAIGGIPADQARQWIETVERHNRSYYAGYLGPWQDGAGTRLFVNLRCVRQADRAVVGYAGGGIVRDSDPAAEWEETCDKLEALFAPIRAALDGAAAGKESA